MANEQETKKTFSKEVEKDFLKRKKDLSKEDIKKFEKRNLYLERKTAKNGNEYVTCKLQVHPDHKKAFVSPQDPITPIQYELIELQNGLQPKSSHSVSVPVRFLKGVSETTGNEYHRVEIMFSKDVYRSVFIPNEILTVFDIKKIKLNFEEDSYKPEEVGLLWE